METEGVQSKPKTSPKDFFLHLLAIFMLYASAVAFTTLIFQYININFPDLIGGGYYPESIRSVARGALAALIVVFPVYLLSSWYLNKEYARDPMKRELRIRKWLIYFTLFAAALIIIGDLVALVRSLLDGELTVRFVLKVITIGFVAGSIFGYYLSDIKRNK